ncbi:MAG: FAD:protein FMN transferase [Candidatus Cryptobacteroides sp.]
MLRTRKEYVGSSGSFHGVIDAVMGTALEVLFCGGSPEAKESLWDWLCVEAGRIQKAVDRFNPDSELSVLNRSLTPLRVSGTLSGMIRTAIRYHRLTDSLFDVAKGGLQEVLVDDAGLVDLHGHELDFGGMAKGFLLSRLQSAAGSMGMDSLFADFGGSSILALGHHPYGDCWSVGVRNPFRQDVLEEVELRNQAMSTSGNTPTYFSHIINPLDGKAVTARRQVTVVSDDALDAEVLSTALMIADRDASKRIAARFPGCIIKEYEV